MRDKGNRGEKGKRAKEGNIARENMKEEKDMNRN